MSREKVWDNGLFPHRLPIKFTHILSVPDRPSILGEVRDVLGPRYGWRILTQQLLESPNADKVARAIVLKPNALLAFQKSLAKRLEEARVKRGPDSLVG